MDQTDIESLSLMERLVLLGIADGVLEDEDPVPSWDVRDRCDPLVDEIDAEIVSKPAEQDVIRALQTLGSQPYVHENMEDTSPAGKGRPKYSLTESAETILDAIETDERLADAVGIVRESV
ncbi:MAG: hypothetical protein ACOCY1_01875 [Halovenus sp.]